MDAPACISIFDQADCEWVDVLTGAGFMLVYSEVCCADVWSGDGMWVAPCIV
jgi:hypothetical protein